jgi:hypothetical protein
MERFLLFDSGCSSCSELAHAIERETDGLLKARSLREREIQTLLDRVRPGWYWEPTLMEVQGDSVRIFTGLAMRLRIFTGLGPKRTWRIARLVRGVGVPLIGVGTPRRQFLAQTARLLAGAALLGLIPKSVWAAPSQDSPNADPLNGAPYSVGPVAWALGVRSYEVTASGNGLIATFTHVDSTRQGKLHIQASNLATGKKILLKLERSNAAESSIVWDTPAGEIVLTDTKSRAGTLLFKDKTWNGNDQSWQVLKENENDFKLMAAIAADFPLAGPERRSSVLASGSKPVTTLGICCNEGQLIVGEGWQWTRSEACADATANANSKCSNSVCWGCCRFLSDNCDCGCAGGDFMCYCQRTARPCMNC